MKAKNLLSSINTLSEPQMSVEEFDQQAKELFTEIAAQFKQQLSTNLGNAKFQASSDETKLSRRVTYPVFYPDFFLMSSVGKLEIIKDYAHSFCKKFKSSPVVAIDHMFDDGDIIILIISKNKTLDHIFGEYLRIEFDKRHVVDKDHFNLIIHFGDYLSVTLNTHSFFRSINIRDKQKLPTTEKMKLLQLFVLEMKKTINTIAKTVRLLEV